MRLLCDNYLQHAFRAAWWVGGRAYDVVSVPGPWVMGSSPEESI